MSVIDTSVNQARFIRIGCAINRFATQLGSFKFTRHQQDQIRLTESYKLQTFYLGYIFADRYVNLNTLRKGFAEGSANADRKDCPDV